jgi:hypothetical protein
MSFLNKCLAVFVGLVTLPLAMWLAISSVNRHDYLNLIRGGLLLCGLGGIAWGILWHNKGNLIAIGGTLLVIGFLSFYVDGFSEGTGWSPLGQSEFGNRLRWFLSYPVGSYPSVPLYYVLLGSVLAVNAVMFARSLGYRRVIAVNILIAVGIGLLSMFWPC